MRISGRESRLANYLSLDGSTRWKPEDFARSSIPAVWWVPASRCIRGRCSSAASTSPARCSPRRGDKPVCVLKGLGITVTGRERGGGRRTGADLNALATVTLEPARLGTAPERVPAEDVSELPGLRSAFNDLSVWRYPAAKERSRAR
jgi:hypothetical protein